MVLLSIVTLTEFKSNKPLAPACVIDIALEIIENEPAPPSVNGTIVIALEC